MLLPIHWRENGPYPLSVTISVDGMSMTIRAQKRHLGTFHEEEFNVDGHGIGRSAARLRNLADWLDSTAGE